MALTTDVTPRVNLTPAQVLQDDHRMKRLTLAFCDGLLSYADEATANTIMEEARKICGGDPDTLTEVLQARFFADHTPFYWVIVNRHGREPEVPPLLPALLEACPVLRPETQDEILDFLYSRYDSDIYAVLKGRLTDVRTHEPYSESMIEGDEDRPRLTAVTSEHGAEIEFHIPRFLDRMLVDGNASLRFLALDREWHFEAAREDPDHQARIGTHWKLRLTETQCRPNAVPNSSAFTEAYIHLDIRPTSGGAQSRSQTYQSVDSEYRPGGPCYDTFEQRGGMVVVEMSIRDKDLSQFYCNPFTTGGRRCLKGSIAFGGV